jgi:AAA15 family ATPase/GTPase
MRINSLTISNLFSFDDATIFLGKHNVITGPNDVCKSNLIRILKRLITDGGYGFSVSYIEDFEKI